MFRLPLALALLVSGPAVAAENFVLSCTFGSQAAVFAVEEPAFNAFGYLKPTIRLSGSQPGQTRPVLVVTYDDTTIRLAISRTDAPVTSTREEHLSVDIDRASGQALIRRAAAAAVARGCRGRSTDYPQQGLALTTIQS